MRKGILNSSVDRNKQVLNFSIWILFLIHTLLLFTPISAATPVINVDDQQQEYSLDDALTIYEDVDGLLTIDDISSLDFQNKFSLVEQGKHNKGYTSSVYWVRISLQNNSKQVVNLKLIHKHVVTNFIDLYIPNEQKNRYVKHSSGYLVPIKNKAVIHRKAIFNLTLKNEQGYTVFIRLKTDSVMNLSMGLKTDSALAEEDISEAYQLGAYYGLLLLLLLMNLSLYLFIKNISYLYLSIFNLGIGISFFFNDGLALSWLDEELVQYGMAFLTIPVAIGMIALLLFSKKLLKEIYVIPVISKGHYVVIFCWLITIVLQLIFNYRATYLWFIFSSLIGPVFLFGVGLVSWNKKLIRSKFYLIGLTVLFIGVTLQVLSRIDDGESIVGVADGARIGLIFFLLFMIAAIIDYVRELKIKEEKVTSALVTSKIESHNNEEKFSKSFFYSPIPMVLYDYNKGERHAVNNSFLKLVGYSEHEVLSNDVFELNFFADQEQRKELTERFINDAKIFREHVKLIHKTGRVIDTLLSVSMLDIASENLSIISYEDITEVRKKEKAIHEIAVGVSANQNNDFFNNLVIQLSKVFDASYVFMGLIDKTDSEIINTYAICADGEIIDNISYNILNTPCAEIIATNDCFFAADVKSYFSNSHVLNTNLIESYIGVPLNDSNGNAFGVLVVLKNSAIKNIQNNIEILNIFASRAASEIERYFADKNLKNIQNKLSLHIEQTPLAAIEWNVNFEVVSWNASAEKMFGYSASEAIGKVAVELIIPNHYKAQVDEVWKSLLSLQGGESSINENITKKGELIVCEWHNTPLVDDSGTVVGVTSLASDITNEKALKDELIIREKRQAAILGSMSDGVVTFNSQGEILSCNQSAITISGYESIELVSHNVSMFILNDFSNNVDFAHYLIETYSLKSPGPEAIAIKKDKTNFPIRISVVELKGSNKSNEVYVLTFHDLTEVKRQEEQLRRSQKMDALGKLTGGISHDFNNLLSVILGYSELLTKSTKSDLRLSRYSHEIKHAAERGAKLTKKLLGFSRTKRPETTTVDINELLSSQKHLLEKTLTARIKLILELEDNLWSTNIDASDFEDSILNISINAMHAIDGVGQITIKTLNLDIPKNDAAVLQIEAGEYILLQFTDTGCGIDNESVEKIFDPFYTTKGEKGTGLGLSQVYGFMKNNGGAIKVYSELEHGTQFNFYFKREDFANKSVNTCDDDTELTIGGSETILVLDDEEALRDLSTEVLSEKGYNVIAVSTPLQALDVLKSKKIDLLLSDVIMPEMDGYELAKIVQEKYPKVIIQLVSGFTDDREKNVINELYYKQLLQKPFSITALLSTIRNRLDSH